MQGRSKRKSCLNNPYTSRSASTIYNSKILQTLPLSSLRVQQISPSWSKHKILAPALSYQKNWGKEKRFQRKCVTLWGRLTASTRQNMPCGSYLSSKNNDLPSFSAAQEPTSSTSKKRRIKKDNHLIVNRFISDQPANSGSTSIFHTPHQRWLFDRVKGQ